jgi:hypothetical protein
MDRLLNEPWDDFCSLLRKGDPGQVFHSFVVMESANPIKLFVHTVAINRNWVSTGVSNASGKKRYIAVHSISMDLDQLSLETVQMFHNDALKAGYRLGMSENVQRRNRIEDTVFEVGGRAFTWPDTRYRHTLNNMFGSRNIQNSTTGGEHLHR